jgi:hypothetical protein
LRQKGRRKDFRRGHGYFGIVIVISSREGEALIVGGQMPPTTLEVGRTLGLCGTCIYSFLGHSKQDPAIEFDSFLLDYPKSKSTLLSSQNDFSIA